MKALRVGIMYILVISSILFLYPKPALAIYYDLLAPSETLTRGQEVQFVITVDAEGTPITSNQIGMTYESQYLQYVNTIPGDAMDSVSVTKTDDRTLIISGQNSQGFNASGVFAYVTFKIIAENPGTTELCALFYPEASPTPSVPLPTSLPQTGNMQETKTPLVAGVVLVASSVGAFFLVKRYSGLDYRSKKHS